MCNSYNWSSLDRKILFHILFSIKNQIIDINIKIDQFHNIITKTIKDSLPLRVRKEKNTITGKGEVLIGGVYYGNLDENLQKSIEIKLCYHKFDKKIIFTNNKFKKFCKLFADTVLHEIIHMRQYRRREFKEILGYDSTSEKTKQFKEQTYLGHPDEIGAYSFNIACELHDKFKGDKNKIVEYLNKSIFNHKSKNCWEMYLKAFDFCHTHPVIKKIKKRTMYYIARDQINKPFQTKDWISA
jgi:hypothetical protein